MLSPKLLDLLRTYWRWRKPKNWLFPGDKPDFPIHQSAIKSARKPGLRRASALTSYGIRSQPIFWMQVQICVPFNCCWATRT
jgi:hypothetical protein